MSRGLGDEIREANMADHFLGEFIKSLDSDSDSEVIGCEIGKPWYNPYGDSVHFRTMQDAYIGDRVDEFLTIFRHHADDHPIGFQLKGIMSLIKILEVDGIAIELETNDELLKKVSMSALLFTAFRQPAKQKQSDESRQKAYTEALTTAPDKIAIPAKAAA